MFDTTLLNSAMKFVDPCATYNKIRNCNTVDMHMYICNINIYRKL